MAEDTSFTNSNENNECDDEGVVTMVDVLKAEEILEENADAVLGPGDDKNCTYKDGYLKRQALYSCLTCQPVDGSERAGVCLACSYHCHADHELVELYTKRNFRCDCGNSLFKSCSSGWRHCSLDPIKSPINEQNTYNQNFRGVYCSCSRPYPDPEDSVEDAMFQCIICEDWFHSRHLETEVPKGDDFSEMICGPCTDKLPFLQYYLGHAVSKVTKEEGTDGDSSVVDVNTSLESATQLPDAEKPEINKSRIEEKYEPTDTKDSSFNEANTTQEESKDKVPSNKEEESSKENAESSFHENESNKEADVEEGCKLKSLKMLPRGTGATFWPENFRKLLCACSSCKEVYEKLSVPFITDEADTVIAYEEEGKTRKSGGPTQYERGMQALSSLDRVQQMEAILGYNEMKSHLSEYLAKFVENKKVVREEDIREFFTGMQARKRLKLDIPYNCR